MREIAHGDLRAEILDPVADRARLGARYAWGGFIWQVHHRLAGPLLTGPEWPGASPIPFNGQGLPESFRHKTRDGRPLMWRGERGLALGAGELATVGGQLQVVAPCEWTLTEFACGIRFRTRQDALGWSYQLERTIECVGHELRSSTRLTNLGSSLLQLEWFAHPFFALTEGLIEMQLPPATRLPENPGFSLVDGRLRQKRRFVGKDDGHFDVLTLPAGEPLRCRLSHPRLAGIEFATSFVPTECVIWGNGNTFSIEPYLALSIEPGATENWHLTYDFGAPR